MTHIVPPFMPDTVRMRPPLAERLDLVPHPEVSPGFDFTDFELA